MGDAVVNTPPFAGHGVNGPHFRRMIQDLTVQRERSSRTQNVEVIIQQTIRNEQSEGWMEDLRLGEQWCREGAMSQHELLARAEASAQYSEGQLNQARRSI